MSNMTGKRIKNEQWNVKELISQIMTGSISKPKYQRRKKWYMLPSKPNTPDEQSYIKFLLRTRNSVHAITFGQDASTGTLCFSNIDGNNRINAIEHFMNKPFDIFPDQLDSLITFIKGLDLSEEEENKILENNQLIRPISSSLTFKVEELVRLFKKE